MLYGISGSLLPLECGMSNHPNVHLFTLDTEELYTSFEVILIPIFVHNNSHNCCILYHQSYVRGLVTLCLASTANHSTFIYRMNDEGLAVLTTLWIGTRFALEWTYIGSIFTIHYKVDSLLN